MDIPKVKLKPGGKVGIIVQARMGSTRLPGKVLKKILGKTLLEYQAERLLRIQAADRLIIATSTSPADQPIVDLCEGLNLSYFRGSLDDVLSRYKHAADLFEIDTIVRITSDCPLIDPDVVQSVIEYYLEHQSQFDYVSNNYERSYPRGLDAEVFSKRSLNKAFRDSHLQADREHVTYHIYSHPEKFKITTLRSSIDLSHHRWTVDTEEDFKLIELILSDLYPTNPHFNYMDVLQSLKRNPDWVKINQNIVQKPIDSVSLAHQEVKQ